MQALIASISILLYAIRIIFFPQKQVSDERKKEKKYHVD